ncbi:MAG: EamA family transporter [Bacteroidota bacterium]
MKIYIKSRLWLLYAILAAFTWAVWGILTKFISGNLSPYSNQILFTIGMLFSLPFVIGRCKRVEINVKGIMVGICASLLAIIGNISVYKSFMLGGQASVVLPFTNLYPLVTILIALLIFKEKLHFMNCIGIAIVMPAIIILSGQSQVFYHPLDFFQALGLKVWLLFAFISLLLFGLFSASQKVTTKYISAGWSYMSFIISSIIISVFFIAFGLVDFNFSQKTFWVGSMAGLFDGLGVLAIYSAYRAEGKAAQVSSIVSSIQQVFTICLAIFFLKEKLTIVEFIGIGLAILGSWFILFEKNKKGL